MGFLTQVSQLILIGYGGLLVIRGELPLGAGMFVFANLIHEFANQVGQIINIANSIQTSLTVKRVFEILDAPVEIQSPQNAIQIPCRGSITFENVSFAYSMPNSSLSLSPSLLVAESDATLNLDARSTLVLRNVNLKIQPGECVGIVGETGAGNDAAAIDHSIL